MTPKTSLLFVLMAILTLSLSSCGGGSKVDRFESKLKEKGVEFERSVYPYGGMIGAKEGWKFENDHCRIEVYRYESSSGKIEEIAEDGVNGVPAYQNGRYLLFDCREHPKWKTIKRAFLNL